MAKIVGQLKAKLGLDSSQYEKGLKKSKKKTSTFASSLKKVGAAAAAAFGIQKIGQFIGSTVKATAATNRMAERLGVGVESMQELNYAAKQFGVNSDAMQDGLKELTMRVDEFAATGKGPASEVMKKLGITRSQAEQLKGNTEMLFNTMVNQISKVQNTAERQRIADELFGGQGGEQMVAMLAAGTDEINKFRKEAQKIGAVIPKKEADKMEKFQRQMDKIGGALKGVGRQIVSLLIPVFQKLIDLWPVIKGGIVDVINYFIDLYNESVLFRGAIEAIKFGFKSMWEVIKLAGKNIIDIFSNIGKLIKQVFTGQWDKIGNTVKQFGKDISSNFKDFGKNTAKNFKEGMENTLKRDKIKLLDSGTKSQAKKDAFQTGKAAGMNFNRGVQRGMRSEMEKMEGKKEGISGSGGIPAVNQLASVDKALKKNKQLQQQFQANQSEVNLLGNVSKKAFQGMSNSLQRALEDGKNILDSFGKFFIDMLKSLIIKLVAAATAAFVLSLLLGGTGIGGLTKSFGSGGFKQAFGMIGGFGMQEGGVIPPGYPNDSYPAMLTSGEKVVPPGKLPGDNTINIKGEFVTRGSDLIATINNQNKKQNRTT